MIMTSIKRIRDAGEKGWKLLIPIYNLKLLLVNESKTKQLHRTLDKK